MKKAPIAIALVLVFGLFAAAFSLAPAVAQNLTSDTTGNATTTGNQTGNATDTNATTTATTNATEGGTFSASGSIAALIFDIGEITTTSEAENETATTGNETGAAGNMTTGNATTSGNTTSADNMTTTMPQIMTGDNATGGDNMTGTTTDNAIAMNETAPAEEMGLPYVLAGDWSLDVQDGNVSDFAANFTMVHIDGTERHIHELSNFVMSNSSSIDTSGEEASFIFGTVDIATDGEPRWTGTDALIIIEKNNVISISLATEDTEDHFMGQPIQGIVDSMTDEGGNEMIEGGTAPAGNATGGAMGGNATGRNETGGFLGELSEGVENLTSGQ
jgi:hypothetical protein